MGQRGLIELGGFLREPSSRARVRKLAAVIGALFVAAACVASGGASMNQRSIGDADCTWGASSITASYENGQLVESKPQTSGCTSAR